MLHKNNSGIKGQFKYLFPLVFTLIFCVSQTNGQPKDKDERKTVPDEIPVFPGCEGTASPGNCFTQKMKEHIARHFQYPLTAQKKKIEGKVITIFVINKKGEIVDISAQSPHPLLEKEAKRIIQKLPKMTPGKVNGKPVAVPLSIPIVFRL